MALFYLMVTTALADGLGVPFQLALAIGFGAGMVAHFILQRVFVWVHQGEFALLVHQQVGRYLVLAGLQYGTTAAVTRFIPDTLGLSVTVVYVATAIFVAMINFLVFRARVFHPRSDLPRCAEPGSGSRPIVTSSSD